MPSNWRYLYWKWHISEIYYTFASFADLNRFHTVFVTLRQSCISPKDRTIRKSKRNTQQEADSILFPHRAMYHFTGRFRGFSRRYVIMMQRPGLRDHNKWPEESACFGLSVWELEDALQSRIRSDCGPFAIRGE